MTPLPPMPEPPPPIEVPADGPTQLVPLATLRWLALRDAYAEDLAAYSRTLDARLTFTRAELAAVEWDRDSCRASLELVQEQPPGPRWSWVAGAALGGLVVGVVAWESIR